MGEVGALWEWVKTLGAAEIASAAGLGVALVGIVLTFLQVFLLRRQLKLDALIRIMDSNRQIVALGFKHPLVWAALEGKCGALLAEEMLAHRRYLQLWMNHMQIMWAAWQLGLVSGCEWEAYRLDMTDFLRAKALREHWARVAPFYPLGFRRLIAELSNPKGSDGADRPGQENGGDCLEAQSTKP